MAKDIKAIELNDEQLEAVVGGDQSNSNGTANLSEVTNVTPVIASAVLGSNVGSTSVGQLSSTQQINKITNQSLW